MRPVSTNCTSALMGHVGNPNRTGSFPKMKTSRPECTLNHSQMNLYKLREAMVAVSRDVNGQMKIVTLPVDAVLKVATISLQSGMLDAQWEGQTVSVFAQDLKARGDLLRAVAVG